MKDLAKKFFFGCCEKYSIVLFNKSILEHNISDSPLEISYYSIFPSEHQNNISFDFFDDFSILANEYFFEKSLTRRVIKNREYKIFKKHCYGLYQNYYEAFCVCFMLNFLEQKGFLANNRFLLSDWGNIANILNEGIENNLVVSDLVYFFSSFLYWCSINSEQYNLGKVKINREFSLIPSLRKQYEILEKKYFDEIDKRTLEGLRTNTPFLFFDLNPHTSLFILNKKKSRVLNTAFDDSIILRKKDFSPIGDINVSNLSFSHYDIVAINISGKKNHLFYGVWKFSNGAICGNWDIGNIVNSFISDAINPSRNGKVWYLLSHRKSFNGIEFDPLRKSLVLAKNLVLFFEILASNNIDFSQIDYNLISKISHKIKQEINSDPRFVNLFGRVVLSFFSWCYDFVLDDIIGLCDRKTLLGSYSKITFTENKTLDESFSSLDFSNSEYLSLYC